MKKYLCLVFAMLLALCGFAQQTVTLKFTSDTQYGEYFPFDQVTVTDNTHSWTETLNYPDTTLVITYGFGVDETMAPITISDVYPNPLRGHANMDFYLAKSGDVTIRVIQINGKTVAEYSGCLEEGLNRMNVDIEQTGMMLVEVTTENGCCAKKILNMEKGGYNNITVAKVSDDKMLKRNTRGVGDFEPGDNMSYFAVRTIDGTVITSELVEQQQFEDENLTLTFTIIPLAIVTDDVTDIAWATAKCGGTITAGSLPIIERGVCYGTTANPTIADEVVVCGSGAGDFTANLTGLTPETTYYVRAYAKTMLGVTYGTQKEFATTEQVHMPAVAWAQEIFWEKDQYYWRLAARVVDDGAGTITERGFMVGNTYECTGPYFRDVEDGEDYFYFDIPGDPGYKWYVKATVKNEFGVAYTNVIEIVYQIPPEGTTGELFSIDDYGKKVWFANGNLFYWEDAGGFDFQGTYSYLGTNNNMTEEGPIDLFGWGTSNNNHGAVCWRPWSTSTNSSDYWAYGIQNLSLYSSSGIADWGHNNIVAGHPDDGVNTWETMSNTEWNYVLYNRNTPSNIRFAKAKVMNKNCLILLPDNWSSSYYSLNETNNREASFDSNVISSFNQWNTLRDHGAVFLPCAGKRNGTSVAQVNEVGWYWTSSSYNATDAYAINFSDSFLGYNIPQYRYMGCSVRLVYPKHTTWGMAE